MTRVTLRRPCLADLDAVARLHFESWRTTYDPILPPAEAARLTLEERRSAWHRLLAAPRAGENQWVAELDGRIAGLVAAGPAEGEGGEVGEIHAIHQAPRLRGRGIGRRLLAAGTRDLRAAGFSRAVLWALAANAGAHRFYEALGWSRDGISVVRPMGGIEGLPTVEEVRYARELSGPG